MSVKWVLVARIQDLSLHSDAAMPIDESQVWYETQEPYQKQSFVYVWWFFNPPFLGINIMWSIGTTIGSRKTSSLRLLSLGSLLFRPFWGFGDSDNLEMF